MTAHIFTPLSGTFHRIVFAAQRDAVLSGAHSPEGRYHHDGQPALYASSRVDWAWVAVDAYLRPEDPPRVVARLSVTGANVVDLRDMTQCAALGLTPSEAAVPWQPERAQGLPATSWRVSDAVRKLGADGMIYRARSDPARWHLVLFRWNVDNSAQVRVEGFFPQGG